MVLDMMLLEDKSLNCWEIAVATVLKWLGFDYELMLYETWGFDLLEQNHKRIGKIGERINMQSGDVNRIINDIYNIEIQLFQETNIDNAINIFKSELAAGNPIFLFVDSFWYPWDNGYQSYHLSHACIIIGFNHEKKGFNCIDPFYEQKEIFLTEQDLKKLYTGHAILKQHNTGYIGIDTKALLLKAYDRLKGSWRETTAFQDIHKFAELVLSEFDYSIEFENEENIFLSPLLWNIDRLGKGRIAFSRLLTYIAQKCGSAKLKRCAESLEVLGERWATVRAMFVKAYNLKDSREKLLKRIADKILSIASDEERLAEEMISQDSDFLIELGIEYKEHEIEGSYQNIAYIDISEYLNNIGFSKANNDENTADLTGIGEFFISEGFPTGDIFKVDNLSFYLPICKYKLYDNISCSGQAINIHKKRSKYIMILACSEWGSCSEEIKIKYADGKELNLLIRFTDWYRGPVFGEKVAWTGKGAAWKDNKVQLFSGPVHLFANSYKLNYEGEIESIQLPDCPNMHIFAISLSIDTEL